MECNITNGIVAPFGYVEDLRAQIIAADVCSTATLVVDDEMVGGSEPLCSRAQLIAPRSAGSDGYPVPAAVIHREGPPCTRCYDLRIQIAIT